MTEAQGFAATHGNCKAELSVGELEADGLVAHTVHPQVPPWVDDAPSPMDSVLIPVRAGLHAWGDWAVGTVEVQP